MLPPKQHHQRLQLEQYLMKPSLSAIRQNYLRNNCQLPPDTKTETMHRKHNELGTSLRGRIYKACIFRKPIEMDVDTYCAVLEKNGVHSEEFEGIYGDVQRSCAIFEQRVDQDQSRRLLQAFCLMEGPSWYSQASPYHAALFLYHCCEIESFYLYQHWMKHHVPVLFQLQGTKGAYAVLELSRRILHLLDPHLEHFLFTQHNADYRMFAPRWVISFFADQNPLQEVIQLWDFFVLFGFHFISLAVASFLILHRNQILEQNSLQAIYTLLKDCTISDAQQLVLLIVRFTREIPEDLYSDMLNVMTKKEVASRILKEEVETK